MKPTPGLLKLQRDLIDAVTPLTVKTATSAAFVTTPEDPNINPLLIHYVEVFATEHAGQHFLPHVTTGLASREYLDKMLAETFADFNFSPASAAVYQLGHFGTAAKNTQGVGGEAMTRAAVVVRVGFVEPNRLLTTVVVAVAVSLSKRERP